MALCMMLALSFFCAYARELTISSEKAVYEVGEMIKWKMTGFSSLKINTSYFEVYIDGEKVVRSPTLSGNASRAFTACMYVKNARSKATTKDIPLKPPM